MALQIDRLALWKEKPRAAEMDPDSAWLRAGTGGPGPRPGVRAPRGRALRPPVWGSWGTESNKLKERASCWFDPGGPARGGRTDPDTLCLPIHPVRRRGRRPGPLCASRRGDGPALCRTVADSGCAPRWERELRRRPGPRRVGPASGDLGGGGAGGSAREEPPPRGPRPSGRRGPAFLVPLPCCYCDSVDWCFSGRGGEGMGGG